MCRTITLTGTWVCLEIAEALLVRVVAPGTALVMLVGLSATGTLTEKSAIALLAVLAGSRAPVRRGGRGNGGQ